MISQRAVDAIEASDTDDLLRVVDGYCAAAAWDDLLELRSRCREAVTRGKQVWGVEEHIRYRVTLEAPAEYAGRMLSEGAARFGLGPLPEVAASRKTWRELEPYIEPGPERATFAAERVVRGEFDIGPIPDLPDRLAPWEPSYPVATYKPDKVEAPSPQPPVMHAERMPARAERVSDPESEAALAELVLPWTDQSNGTCDTTTASGSATAAIRSLGLSSARMAALDTPSAIAWMGWAGASGGAYGQRRGAAAGRYGAWWVLASVGDLDWPPDPDHVAAVASRLRFFWFDDGAPGTGWALRLAIEDPASGLAWAVSAIDSRD